MQYRLKYLSVVIGLTCAATMFNANAADVVDLSMTNNVPEFQSATSVRTLKNILSNDDSFALSGNENFVVTDYWVDELGKSHTRFDQLIDGIKVYGTSITVHENRGDGNTLMASTASSNVYFISGAVYMVKIDYFLKYKKFITNNSIPFIMSQETLIDIDNPFHLKIANIFSKHFKF